MGTCDHGLEADLRRALTGKLDLERVLQFGHADAAHRRASAVLQARADSGQMTVRRHALPAPGDTTKDDLKPFVGRSDEHRRLCLRLARWLEGEGLSWSTKRASLRYPGGVADVSSDGLLAEVGYVRADRVLAGVNSGLTMAAVPYAHEAGLPWDVVFLLEQTESSDK